MLAAVCSACVVSDGSAAMLWTVEEGVYAVCELNCSKSCCMIELLSRTMTSLLLPSGQASWFLAAQR